MNRTQFFAVIGLLVTATTVLADLAPPLPPAKQFKVQIEVDANAKAPRVIVPWTAVNEPRRRPVPAKAVPPEEKRGELNFIDPSRNARLRWTAVGSTLALSVAFGGLWFLRRGPGQKNALAVLAAVAVCLGTGAMLSANIGPAGFRAAPKTTTVDADARVEVIHGGEAIRIILDKSTFDRLSQVSSR